MTGLSPELNELASLYGVQTRYHDIWGQERHADREVVLSILRALGASEYALDNPRDGIYGFHRDIWQRLLPPVIVAWMSQPEIELAVHIPTSLEEAHAVISVRDETGHESRWDVQLGASETIDTAEFDGQDFAHKRLRITYAGESGYARLRLDIGSQHAESWLLSAPDRAWSHGDAGERSWGVFIPLHALRSRRTHWGGHLGDLEHLASWTARQGGSYVGILPLLATFLDSPFDPSPYSPASRLFWNELYLDPSRLVGREMMGEQAITPVSSADTKRVDYREWANHQNMLLGARAEAFFANGGAGHSGYRTFLEQNRRVDDYAQFRAVGDRERAGWIIWPESARDGRIADGDFEPARADYHRFAQWQMSEQLQSFASSSADQAALYLDFPLGVHPDSYDVWRERESFAQNISVGAPPDMFFTGGQNWGFPPLHPGQMRERGFEYLKLAIRHHMRYSGALRIDHVMGLYRLYWIPRGVGAQDGVYVTYPADELQAVLSIESHRAKCTIIGEDLGTVPDRVRASMGERNLLRMYVAQFEMTHDSNAALNTPPKGAMASLNTHDTVLFGGFFQGRDIDISHELGFVEDADAAARHRYRAELMESLAEYLRSVSASHGEGTARMVLEGTLKHLAASEAEILMISIEDLWLEPEPQNVPGTGDDWGNWRRKAQFTFEEFSTMPEVMNLLRAINELRGGKNEHQ